MTRLWLILIALPLWAGIVPDRYMVELYGESAAQFIARTFPPGQRHAALLGAAGQQARAEVRRKQAPVRARLQRRGAVVIGSLDTVGNLLFVRTPAARIAWLRNVPGVRRILPERTYRLTLDHALPLHKVPQAWSLGGAYPQGMGVKIGMIDTGIQISHPGFSDAGFQAPPGFPMATAASDLAFTNQKVIVARTYVNQCLMADPDTSARDDVGHGTGTAMAAAGVQNTGSLGTITGVAPLAYLGNYKVFGSPGVNDETNSCAIDQAIENAVNDGMDVINLSLGAVPAPRTSDDDEVQAVEAAISAGVMVVIAAGNNGPDPNTIGSPGTAPDAITVGAMNNDRIFAAPFTVGTHGPYAAIPADEGLPTTPINAPLVDISRQLDPTGLACGPLPAGSLQGDIALILRGTCTFEVKLDDAQQAGAVAALVYTYPSSPDALIMAVGEATLPAEMVSNADGLAIKQFVTIPAAAAMTFIESPFTIDPNTIAGFSSLGPSVDLSIKPDVVAVGENFYTAAQTTDLNGELYSADGYVVAQGTSYSTPLLTGAVAVIEAARPGLTPLEYKSLLLDSAAAAFPSPDQAEPVQTAGAGVLDLNAAVLSTLAVNPVSLSFGVGAGTASLSSSVRLSNLGYASDTFQISAVPEGGSPAPVPAATRVTLDPGRYFDLALSFTPSRLAAGEYEGFIEMQGIQSGTRARIPYWYGVASNVPAHITVLYVPPSPPAAGTVATDAIWFRITDASGIIAGNVTPRVTATSGGGAVVSVVSADSQYPGVWAVNVRMGPASGASNVFQIMAGNITQTVTIISD
ncbi:MAG TPA: S8 family serine peptidase [Bryobacteraceae bacterium]|nr:S8 family serine peptidase [Bryobacteraceae bacterium]